MENIIQVLQLWGMVDAVITPIEKTTQTTWDIDGSDRVFVCVVLG